LEATSLSAPKGNSFWKARSSHGRKPIFESPEDLWAAASEYFEWVEANPLYEDKVTSFQGVNTHEPIAKMRAMTIMGLCIFLDISRRTWDEYRERQDFLPITTCVEDIIRTQKFEGASADLLNPNIIARDLGLADKSEHTGKDGGPIEVADMTDMEKARRLAFALARAANA
jgi:hypothetical protein